MLLENDFPDDPQALRALVVAAHEQRSQADATIARLTLEAATAQAEVDRLTGAEAEAEAAIARLNAIIAAFQHHRFGARSEKLDSDQFELVLEELGAALSRVNAGIEARAAGTVKPRKTNWGSLPGHLKRIEQVIDIADKTFACCGDALHAIGEDVAERLDVVPATLRVPVIRRPRYGCRTCEGIVVQAPASPRIVASEMATDALVAHASSPSTPITCRSTDRRRSSPARTSSSIARRLPTGLGAPPGG